ncbi:phage major tail tube protein [Paenibacillus xanthanilyticus]|uniref:Phage major tail tube protein n=1 Tax=Paenibacillus xanthanilyticus TaxID=1783531 RepID=A0ABV8KA52_9BACL
MYQIPEKLTAFTVYQNGSTFLGVADVTLPSFEYLSDTIRGAGIAGEIDSPSVGLFGPMSCGLNWRTLERNAALLLAPQSHSLDFRGSQQVQNKLAGIVTHVPVKVTVRGNPKKYELGKMEQNATTDSANEFEVTYIKVVIGGETVIELDKLNFIFIVGSVDYLAQMRANLGL